jgi:hypothetical protein
MYRLSLIINDYFPSPSAPTPKIEKNDNCEGEQRDQKPLPFDMARALKLSIQVWLAGGSH